MKNLLWILWWFVSIQLITAAIVPIALQIEYYLTQRRVTALVHWYILVSFILAALGSIMPVYMSYRFEYGANTPYVYGILFATPVAIEVFGWIITVWAKRRATARRETQNPT